MCLVLDVLVVVLLDRLGQRTSTLDKGLRVIHEGHASFALPIVDLALSDALGLLTLLQSAPVGLESLLLPSAGCFVLLVPAIDQAD